MKFPFLFVSLLIVSPQIGPAAPAPPQSPAPRAGEIALDGSIESLDVIKNTLTLRATSFAVGTGAAKKLPQPTRKVIQLGDATQFLESSGLKNLSLGDLEKGMTIRVVGREVKGKPLATRLITWRAPAPQLALDPLTPRLKAPLLPAPQTQNGITLRVIDAGWKSLSQMLPRNETSTRPQFYFAYNLPGASDGQPASAGWAIPIAERNTKLLRISGPNGEPVSVNSSGNMERESGVYGATRAILSGVNPAWNSVVAEFETLDPAAPADASGEFDSVVSFDKVPVPTKAEEKVEVGKEMTTPHGAKIKLRSVRFGKYGDQERTFFDFAVTPPADVPDLKVALDMNGVKNQDDEAWTYNGWGSGGNELNVRAVPRASDKFITPSLKIKESAPSLKQQKFYRRFRIEIPVAAFFKIEPPQLNPKAPVLKLDGKAFTLEIEPEKAWSGGNWRATAWIKNRGTVADKTERWLLREAKSRVAGKETPAWLNESEYDREFLRMNGTPATPDEHSMPFVAPFDVKSEKFDLELKIEKANRLENSGWMRGVPLPAPGASLDIRDGQFETDHIRIKRVFRFKNESELAGLLPNARGSFGGSNIAVVIDVSPVYPGARVEIPSFRVQNQTGRPIEVLDWMPQGDAGRAGTENTKLRTLIFALPAGSKSLDLWFNTIETAWSGQSETVTLKDVSGKG